MTSLGWSCPAHSEIDHNYNNNIIYNNTEYEVKNPVKIQIKLTE